MPFNELIFCVMIPIVTLSFDPFVVPLSYTFSFPNSSDLASHHVMGGRVTESRFM